MAVALRLKALADPARVKLMSLLLTSAAGSETTGALAAVVGLSESTVSHHLSQLRTAGLARRPVHRAGPELLPLTDASYRLRARPRRTPGSRHCQPSALTELAACMRPRLGGLLSPEQRRALEWTEFDGTTQADAAGREGISVPGMKSRVRRGRQRLAELLGRCCALTLDARGVPVGYTAPTGCRCTDG